MATHKPFRELVNPASNFDFVGKIKTWATISVILVAASIGVLFVNKSVRGSYLNWTIDFSGGTEIIFRFDEKADGTAANVPAGDVRSALGAAGKSGFDLSDFSWTAEDESGVEREFRGMLIRTPEFGAVSKERQAEIAESFTAAFADDGVVSVTWSGDRLFVRSTKRLTWAKANVFFTEARLELKPWSPEDELNFGAAVEGTGEYNAQFSIKGIGTQFQKIIQDALGEDVVVTITQVDGVGAKAGERLKNDGLKSLFYAMALIMLYLAFRFDVRYAPGAVVALLHDSLLVVGVFAATWQPVSLTTVAALLTVIGYSVNDSVVIFDRIRENVGRLKDKRFSRIINISLNETMQRTLMTSITLFVVTLMMNIVGTGLVRNFAFAMNIGVVVGVYSSVFVASPVALFIHNKWFAGVADKAKSKGARGTSPASTTAAKKSKKATKPRVDLSPDVKSAQDDDDDDSPYEESDSRTSSAPKPGAKRKAKSPRRRKRK